MKVENMVTSNWGNAFRGMRNPMNSHSRSDSFFGLGRMWDNPYIEDFVVSLAERHPDWTDEQIDNYIIDNGIIRNDKYDEDFVEFAFIGKNDMGLAQRLVKAGTPHDKFLRQIFVSMDLTLPFFMWKEFDTYKVATVANSESTMHKLHAFPINEERFEMDDFDSSLVVWQSQEQGDVTIKDIWDTHLVNLEHLRNLYNQTGDKRYWKELVRLLPDGWLQKRTWSGNYSTLRNIIHWRQNHKLQQWRTFVDACRSLPYADELLFFENKEK